MRSATDFLPLTITWLMNFATVWLAYLGSGRISRLADDSASRHGIAPWFFRVFRHLPNASRPHRLELATGAACQCKRRRGAALL